MSSACRGSRSAGGIDATASYNAAPARSGDVVGAEGLENLGDEYRANSLAGTMAIFETEHLCRWATSLRRPAFRTEAWNGCRVPEPLRDVPKPFALGIGVAPGWERATIVVAAVRPDGRIGAEVFRDLRGEVTPQTVTDAVELFHHEQWAKVIAYDSISGGAGAFDRHATESGLRYDALKPSAMIAAQMDFSEMVVAGRLAVDDPLLGKPADPLDPGPRVAPAAVGEHVDEPGAARVRHLELAGDKLDCIPGERGPAAGLDPGDERQRPPQMFAQEPQEGERGQGQSPEKGERAAGHPRCIDGAF
jgi:hypothetical protein